MLNSKTMIARRARKKVLAFSLQPSAFACAAFTMVEIAISLAIIGIALVAILGVLPIGLRMQRDNREQTVINQDATVLLEAIRGGARGLDDLTHYVYAITNYWTIYTAQGVVSLSGTNGYTYTSSYYSNPPQHPSFQINSGARIIGLLSAPEYASPDQPFYVPLDNIVGVPYVSNHIVAYVRSISGPAVEKPPQANTNIVHDSFTYRVLCVNAPLAADTNAAVNVGYTRQLTANLRELRLTFQWSQLPNGSLGLGRQTYRTMVAGQLVTTTNDPSGQVLYYYQPQSFIINTNAP